MEYTEYKIWYTIDCNGNLWCSKECPKGLNHDGTLDFTSRGAKTRIEIGYLDAIRELEFFGRTDAASKREYEMAASNDYLKIDYMSRQNVLEDTINSEMDKINSLFNKYL